MSIISDESPAPDLAAVVERCIAKLLAEDGFLLDGEVHEQTITGRLVVYLQNEIKDYCVDPEYNRHGVEVKKATLIGGRKKVKPDIVVHRRNSDDHNLLVIEVKVLGRGGAQDREHAHDKLAALVYGDEFRYRYGLFLELGFAETGGYVADAKWYVRNNE